MAPEFSASWVAQVLPTVPSEMVQLLQSSKKNHLFPLCAHRSGTDSAPTRKQAGPCLRGQGLAHHLLLQLDLLCSVQSLQFPNTT